MYVSIFELYIFLIVFNYAPSQGRQKHLLA